MTLLRKIYQGLVLILGYPLPTPINGQAPQTSSQEKDGAWYGMPNPARLLHSHLD